MRDHLTFEADEIEKKLKSDTEYQKVNQIMKKQRREQIELCDRCGSKHETRNCKAYGLENVITTLECVEARIAMHTKIAEKKI